jgi:hypothetical protein
MKKSKIAQRFTNTENLPSYDELFALVADLSDSMGGGIDAYTLGNDLGCNERVALKYSKILRNVSSMTTNNNLWNDISAGTFLD